MKSLSLLFGLTLLFAFSDCQAPLTEKNETTTLAVSTSTDYRPPVFADDDRAKKVSAAAQAFDRLCRNQAAARHIPGLAYGVVVDDSLVVFGATGTIDLEKDRPASTRSAFRIASMTKSFTAMAILHLRDEGKLSLSDPVAKYIPGMAELKYLTDDAPPIDIENLLTMTAGFPEDNPWGDRQLAVPNETLTRLVEEGLSFSNVPSVQYEYSNLGYALLGRIISRVSGVSYQHYIRQHILVPLGMNDTWWEYGEIPEDQLALGYRYEDEEWKDEPMLHDGAFGAMGGLITTIEDFSKYVRFHLSAWPPRNGADEGPVKRSTLREMHTPQFPRLYAEATGFNGETCPAMSGYGYGLSISQDCNGLRRVAHGGALPGFGSNYVFYPDYGVGVMAFGNLTYTGPLPRTSVEALLFDTIGLQPRVLPVSDILKERQVQIVQLIQTWDPALEAEILAENFYLDRSREHRMTEIEEMLEKAGPVREVEPINPFNQLRGRFKMQTENGTISVFFTLTPEKEPKVQQLDVSFQPE